MTEDRGISIVIEYVLIIGFTTILLVAFTVSSAGLLAETTERELERSLHQISEVLVDEIDAVARFATQPAITTVELRLNLPHTIGSNDYQLLLDENEHLRVSSQSHDIRVVRLLPASDLDYVPVEFTGGPLVIQVNDGELTILRDT